MGGKTGVEMRSKQFNNQRKNFLNYGVSMVVTSVNFNGNISRLEDGGKSLQ